MTNSFASRSSHSGSPFSSLYPLLRVWPSGWTWQPSQHEYEQMIVGIYATLGVFLLWASRAPRAHLSLMGTSPATLPRSFSSPSCSVG